MIISHQSYSTQITSVVDHIMGEPVRTNSIWVTIERGEDDAVEFTDKDISDFRNEIPVGAEAYITVEAPDYVDRERVVEGNAWEFMEVAVEIVPMGHRA